jgi:hypothetical protein
MIISQDMRQVKLKDYLFTYEFNNADRHGYSFEIQSNVGGKMTICVTMPVDDVLSASVHKNEASDSNSSS